MEAFLGAIINTSNEPLDTSQPYVILREFLV